jgi:signal peptidase II
MAKTTFLRSSGGSLLPWLALALIILIADQFTKVLILGYYKLGDSTYVTSFFNVVRVHNTGAAFSFLASASGWQRWFFTGIGVAAALFIVWMLRAHPGQRLFSFALACILGGAIGNVVDRLLHGYVVDFLDFHWAGWHFPAFNLADAAISIGGGGLPGLSLGRLALPGLQPGGRRHLHRRGLPDPGRAASRAPVAVTAT